MGPNMGPVQMGPTFVRRVPEEARLLPLVGTPLTVLGKRGIRSVDGSLALGSHSEKTSFSVRILLRHGLWVSNS